MGQSGQKWYHWSCLIFGHTTAPKNLSICKIQNSTYLLYKHAFWSYKLMNENPTHTFEWAALNANITFMSRQTTFITSTDNAKRVGLNAIANKISIINNLIPLNWFNLSFNTFKIKCKEKFIK